ncbi:MAG TPA: hypothetical protein VM344_10495 [Vitreimonas sp.]|nr:hypothetical protein [Vitreimonas sp.]
MTLAQLGKEFLPRRWRNLGERGDRYTIVLPYPEPRPFVRSALNLD